ncbi:MAG: DUF1788 domain-containing protein [Candidatus Izemoplasmataceae bacterium]
MDRNLTERFIDFENRMSSIEILTKYGTANDMKFYIFDYDPKDELRVRKEITKIRGINPEIIEFDLYNMLLEVIKREGYFDTIRGMEKEYDPEVMLNSIFQPLLAIEEENNPIISIFKETASDDGSKIVLITGVGKAYPIIRSHSILNNLQSVFKNNPVVMMYPGKYEVRKKMTLRLFDRLDDDNYYRAFALVERGK